MLLTLITPCMLQDLQEPGHHHLAAAVLDLCVVQVRVHPYLVAAGQDLQEPGHHHLADAVFDPSHPLLLDVGKDAAQEDSHARGPLSTQQLIPDQPGSRSLCSLRTGSDPVYTCTSPAPRDHTAKFRETLIVARCRDLHST